MQRNLESVVKAFGDKDLFDIAMQFHGQITLDLADELKKIYNLNQIPLTALDLNYLFSLMLHYVDISKKNIKKERKANRFYQLRTNSAVFSSRTITSYYNLSVNALNLALKEGKYVIESIDDINFRKKVIKQTFLTAEEKVEFIHDYLSLFLRDIQMATKNILWLEDRRTTYNLIVGRTVLYCCSK